MSQYPLNAGGGLLLQIFSNLQKEKVLETILDIKQMNIFICHSAFRMITLASIIPSNEGYWFVTLNLNDPSFHIDINPAHRRVLDFTVDLEHFQYKALSFGLSVVSRVFAKVVAVVGVHLQH